MTKLPALEFCLYTNTTARAPDWLVGKHAGRSLRVKAANGGEANRRDLRVKITLQIIFSDCLSDLTFIFSNYFERLYDCNFMSLLTFFSYSIC